MTIYITRGLGKSYEEKMYKELGGIADISKLKYHQWISSKLGDISLPMSLAEESEDLQTDEKYINAMRFLRTYANSNRDKLPRVSQDLSI